MPACRASNTAARIIVAGSHETPAMAGDQDLVHLPTGRQISRRTVRHILVWLGECATQLTTPLGTHRPLVEQSAFEQITYLTKHNAATILPQLRESCHDVDDIEVLVCAPLRYDDSIWWALGTASDAVHAFGLVWLVRQLVPPPRGARVVLHPFRTWHPAAQALPIDLPDLPAVEAIEDELNEQKRGLWSCELSDDEEHRRAPHERSSPFAPTPPATAKAAVDAEPHTPLHAARAVLDYEREAQFKPREAKILLAGTPRAVGHLQGRLLERPFAVAAPDTWQQQLADSHILLCALDMDETATVPQQLDALLEKAGARLAVMGAIVDPHGSERWKSEEAQLAIAGSVVKVPTMESMQECLTGFVDEYLAGKRVFISYAEKDHRFAKRLAGHIKALPEREALGIKVWLAADSLQAGDEWHRELVRARAAASVAAVFTSADYFASDYVRANEFPQFIRACKRQDLAIVWQPVTKCLDHGLAELHANFARNLRSLSKDKQEAVLCKMAQDIASSSAKILAQRQRRRYPGNS